ncbi:MAG: hypothetical protein ACOY90_05405 [Candidatus Zhuqueibacterota bacterium]
MRISLLQNSRQATALLILIVMTQFFLKLGMNAAQSAGVGSLLASDLIWLLPGIAVYFLALLLIRNRSGELGHTAVLFGGVMNVVVVELASLILNEYVSLEHWVGVGLISVGAILISGDF